MAEKTFRTYPYRWAVLGSFMLVNLVMQALWIDFSPVLRDATAYFGVSAMAIGFFSMLFMIIFVPASIPASWAIDRFGIRKATGLGAGMMAAFAILRALAGRNYALALAGTTGIALAQPLILNAWTKVAARWFAEGERTTAVGLITLANVLGIAAGMVASPALAASGSIGTAQWIYAAAALASAAVYLALVRENPPSPAGKTGAGEKALMLDGLKHALSSPTFRLLLAVSFMGVGVFNGVTTWIEEIVSPRGFSPADSGAFGALMLVGGLLGAVAISSLADRTGKRKVWLLAGILGTLPGLAGMALARPFWLLAASAFLMGFFLTSVLPVGMQFATEAARPSPEGTSNGLIQLCGQLSVAFVYLMQVIKGMTGGFAWSMAAAGVILAAAAFLVPFMRETPRPGAE
jgi:MFS family permease